MVKLTDAEKGLFGTDARILFQGTDQTVYQLGGADGRVKMTRYGVFPGMNLTYNDVHDADYHLNRAPVGDLIEINHCQEGRMECQYQDSFYYLTPGDLSISRKDTAPYCSSFPTGHYHGVTLLIDPNCAPHCLSCMLEDVNVQPSTIADRFCQGRRCFVARSSPRVKHVFSELYAVPEGIRKGYFKVKVLELLLFLSVLPVPPVELEQRCFTNSQVTLAKEVCQYLTDHMDSKITIQELSGQFNASATLIKSSFRGVYGMSPSAFLRAQKMHSAADLLRNSDRTVLDIAGQFGYDNASKFAKAFRDIIGVSPNEYRSGVEQDSCAPLSSQVGNLPPSGG